MKGKNESRYEKQELKHISNLTPPKAMEKILHIGF
jgi:hypothetical protein